MQITIGIIVHFGSTFKLRRTALVQMDERDLVRDRERIMTVILLLTMGEAL